MKFFLQSASAVGNIDPTIEHGIIDHLPGRVNSIAQADCVIVPVSWHPNYQFEQRLFAINKPVVVMDFLEFGWDAGDKRNLLGEFGFWQFGHLSSPEWAKLEGWITNYPPALLFKRELHRRDVSERVRPIEYPCRLEIPPIQTREEFDARPIEVFSSWGLSHPARQRLHGDVFKNAHDKGINVIDSWDDDNKWERRNWVTIFSPHWRRRPLDEVMRWQQRAKVSVSLPGAGIKCFRSAEAPVGSIMALHEDNLAWLFRWVDWVNCIRLEPGNEFDGLDAAFRLDDLYSLYVASQETIARYASSRYATEYVLPAILSAL